MSEQVHDKNQRKPKSFVEEFPSDEQVTDSVFKSSMKDPVKARRTKPLGVKRVSFSDLEVTDRESCNGNNSASEEYSQAYDVFYNGGELVHLSASDYLNKSSEEDADNVYFSQEDLDSASGGAARLYQNVDVEPELVDAYTSPYDTAAATHIYENISDERRKSLNDSETALERDPNREMHIMHSLPVSEAVMSQSSSGNECTGSASLYESLITSYHYHEFRPSPVKGETIPNRIGWKGRELSNMAQQLRDQGLMPDKHAIEKKRGCVSSDVTVGDDSWETDSDDNYPTGNTDKVPDCEDESTNLNNSACLQTSSENDCSEQRDEVYHSEVVLVTDEVQDVRGTPQEPTNELRNNTSNFSASVQCVIEEELIKY